VLHKWIEKSKDNATGNELERALKRINREDIINRCMHNVEEVTDEDEKQQALAFLEGPTVTPTGEFFQPPGLPVLVDVVGIFSLCMVTTGQENLGNWGKCHKQ